MSHTKEAVQRKRRSKAVPALGAAGLSLSLASSECAAIGGMKLADCRLVDWLATHAPEARRTASVCAGAFLLAEAGLLNGRRAATHWARPVNFSISARRA
jgi:transcriptional regulator GlxA family with amidase domain